MYVNFFFICIKVLKKKENLDQSYQSQPIIYEQPVQQQAESTVQKKEPVQATISAEPQLRDLQKELLGFVPTALRRKQTKKTPLPKEAKPHIDE